MAKGLVWLRRDLRTEDHAALSVALRECDQVWIAFIFDQTILEPLLQKGFKSDRRVDFIWQSLQEVHDSLREKNPHSGVMAIYGNPTEKIPQLAKLLDVDCVYTNHDYEPSAIERDTDVQGILDQAGIAFKSFKDQVIFENKEVLSGSGTVYSVFTPYKNAWLKRLSPADLEPYPCFTDASDSQRLGAIPKEFSNIPTLESMGFDPSGIEKFYPVGMSGAQKLFEDFTHRIAKYQTTRNFPAIKGPSYLSTHQRFGTISIRSLARQSHQMMLHGNLGASTWLSELIWRDFYFMILANHPRIAQGISFKADYEKITWETGEVANKHFKAWCAGKTGYPLVDAAMRQLNTTGWMHNRLRMVAACFLIKDLGIDWRWGEAYFADHLNDFDFSANNGGWQWASSSGCDAQPYFRIFNPITQSEKFDKEGKFIKKYCPELASLSPKSIHAPWTAGAIELEAANLRLGMDYPLPIVKHDEARVKTLLRYSVVKSPAIDMDS